MERSFVVTLARYKRNDPSVYVVQGYFQGNSIAGCRMHAMWDRTELPLKITSREGLAVRQKYFSRGTGYEDIDREYDLWITLPEDRDGRHTLRLFQEQDDRESCVFRTTSVRLEKERSFPDGYLETWHDEGGEIAIGGWAVGNTPCSVEVLAPDGMLLNSAVTWHYRQDIVDNYPELQNIEDAGENAFGFEIRFQKPASDVILLRISARDQSQTRRISISKGAKQIHGAGASMLTKGTAYLKRNGVARTWKRCLEKVHEKLTGREEEYESWRRRRLPSKEELQAQTKNEFLSAPCISVLVPLYCTPENCLRELVSSLRAQTYGNWELCMSDGSGPDSPLKNLLQELAHSDSRIHCVDEGRRMGIAENTNIALSLATGEYFAFVDHDDVLPPYALYEVVKKINEEPEADLIYSDEDKISMDGKHFFQPHFKTDFNIDLLCSMNYFCHLVVVKRSLAAEAGPLRDAFDGAQDYDFVLRCAEKAVKICHIPKVLYHWRSHTDSTAQNPKSKMYAFEAGMRAVQAHYDRLGIDAEVQMGAYPGLYRTIYHMPVPAPKISIIIPNKDHLADLDKCVQSVLQRATYPNYEFVIIENNSVEEETFEYYRRMEQELSNFHVCYWDGPFNYSSINNFGVKAASGSYLLFLNNDTELISPDGLEHLIGPCLRDEVGAVGARLYYADDTIQHAGVIIGYGGIAGHAFQGFPRTANGYFSRIICQSDLSAVTAACLMVRRSVFEETGGFDEELKIAFNDIDLCLRIRQAGYLVVYNPLAELYHYESKSRGAEDTPEKIARFNKEADLFLHRWPVILKNGDPYYNPNLSLDRNDFALKK